MEINTTIVFQKNYEALNSDKRFIVNQGSSRSSKSISICQLLIVYALTNQNKIISIVRKTFPALRATAMRDFISILKEQNIYQEKAHNKTENIYTFDNGTIVEFFSVDDEQKIRGRKRDICWIEEANEVWLDDFTQINLRTTEKIFFSYNPSDADSYIYELPEDKIIIKSTYKDNPFLEQSIINQIEGLKETDDALYQIYALGERAVSKQQIYTNWTFTNERPPHIDNFIYACDFGYNHKLALIKLWYNENEIYIEKLIYQSYLTTPELINLMKGLNIDAYTDIVCDYARPEIIKELKDANFNAVNADKSVKQGILNVKRFKVYAQDDNDIKKEYNNYSWKKINDIITDEPIKKWDDIADSIRYGCTHIVNNLADKFFISF